MTLPTPFRTFLLALALASAMLTGCGNGGGSGALPEASDASVPLETSTSLDPALRPVSGAIRVYDQSSDGTSIAVESVEIRGAPGWIVVHVDQEGPGEVVGHAPIPEGPSAAVKVYLDRKMPAGSYWTMIHRDDGAAGTFEWPGPDGPVRPANGKLAYASSRIALTTP